MLYWGLTFLVVFVLAAALGIGGIAGASGGIAPALPAVLLVLVGLSFIAGVMKRVR